jgi:quercetin dioxygenase-like cupin family protein
MRIVRSAELEFGDLPGRRSADPFAGLGAGLDADGISVRLARLSPGPRAPHVHPLSVEVIYVVEGEGVHWQDGDAEPVGPGDVVLVPRGVPHATIPSSERGMLLYCVFPVATLDGNVEELGEPISL